MSNIEEALSIVSDMNQFLSETNQSGSITSLGFTSTGAPDFDISYLGKIIFSSENDTSDLGDVVVHPGVPYPELTDYGKRLEQWLWDKINEIQNDLREDSSFVYAMTSQGREIGSTPLKHRGITFPSILYDFDELVLNAESMNAEHIEVGKDIFNNMQRLLSDAIPNLSVPVNRNLPDGSRDYRSLVISDVLFFERPEIHPGEIRFVNVRENINVFSFRFGLPLNRLDPSEL